MRTFFYNECTLKIFSNFNSKKKGSLDRKSADSIKNNSTWHKLGSSLNLDEVRKRTYGGPRRPSYCKNIWDQLLDLLFNENHRQIIDDLSDIYPLGMSVNDFNDINFKSVFNLIAGTPLPFLSDRLGYLEKGVLWIWTRRFLLQIRRCLNSDGVQEKSFVFHLIH